MAAHMLESLKVKSIQLMTNNPRKIDELTCHTGSRSPGASPW